MFRICFIIYLLIHILGDYYFQGEKLAKEKRHSIKKVLRHDLIYLLVALVLCLPVFTWDMLISVIALSVLHAVIDLAKYLIMKKYDARGITDRERSTSYLIDQGLHLLCIFGIAIGMALLQAEVYLPSRLRLLMENIGFDIYGILVWSVLLLLIFKPANITIKLLLYAYRPVENDETQEGHKNAGAFIGSLERLIILIFLSLGQFSAIGLVLTAKSIARYNRIAEDKKFAEYYLLGTLLSTVFVIGGFLMITRLGY